ncbi:hypothetical protein M422DRAFT_50212 [Sphaerobolus stellatus SS14]|uniref:Homeobox domain-containing protein n=1 Tax=Sphaerobolus stellatus (strain SS14) TaxID=990650 RepID=A0A0C9UST0_SPHS4|nr:hypothetical protein M422DRAFT_50212 [Sphaerobolus stellatus SS14]
MKDQWWLHFPERLAVFGIPSEPRWPLKTNRLTEAKAKEWQHENDLGEEDKKKVEDAKALRKKQIAAWFNNKRTHDPFRCKPMGTATKKQAAAAAASLPSLGAVAPDRNPQPPRTRECSVNGENHLCQLLKHQNLLTSLENLCILSLSENTLHVKLEPWYLSFVQICRRSREGSLRTVGSFLCVYAIL